MENSAIFVQVLVVAAILVYSGWSAMKKASEKKEAVGGGSSGEQRHRMEENFPFPKPTVRPAPVASSVASPAAEVPANGVEKKAVTMTDGLAVASISALTEDTSDEVEDLSSGEVAESKIEIDLRTMVISNELLNPKYREY